MDVQRRLAPLVLRRGSGRDAWTFSVQEVSVRTGLSFILLFLFCQVLKAIGLQRTGKQDEAFSLAQEVSVLEPTDDNSLQALTILYREMHRREYTHTRGGMGGAAGTPAPSALFLSSTAELVAKLYEAAVKKVPLSEEYHSHLFMAYARVGEYKKMQQVRNSQPSERPPLDVETPSD